MCVAEVADASSGLFCSFLSGLGASRHTGICLLGLGLQSASGSVTCFGKGVLGICVLWPGVWEVSWPGRWCPVQLTVTFPCSPGRLLTGREEGLFFFFGKQIGSRRVYCPSSQDLSLLARVEACWAGLGRARPGGRRLLPWKRPCRSRVLGSSSASPSPPLPSSTPPLPSLPLAVRAGSCLVLGDQDACLPAECARAWIAPRLVPPLVFFDPHFLGWFPD